MKRTTLILFALVTLTAPANSMTFDEAVNFIAGKSTAMIRANADAEATAVENSMAGNLTDPEIEGEYLLGNHREDNRWSAGVSQSFDWPGVYSSRRRAAEASTRAARLEAAGVFAETQTNVRLALTDYINACRNIDILDDVHVSLDEIMETMEQHKGDEMSVLDFNKLKIEHGMLMSTLLTWEDRRLEAIARLKEIAPTEDIAGLLSSLDPVYPIYTLKAPAEYVSALGNDNRLKALDAQVEAARLEADVARKERLPGFSIGYKHAYEEATHFNGFTLGLTLPVFSTRNKTAASTARRFAANTALMSMQSTLEAQITSTCMRAKKLKETTDELAEVFETHDNIALLRKALDGGQISTLQFLTEVNYILQTQLDYLDLIYQYNLAMATLSRYDQ